MKITVFTRNQPRHLNYLRLLAEVSDSVRAFIEVNTLFPGTVKDFYPNSPAMRDYFSRVLKAEHEVFGVPRFLSANVETMPILPGDINLFSREQIRDSLDADIFLVFGASWIKGWLAEELVSKRAVNIHTGLAPYYRGSSCNFWALYDKNPGYVGATVHLLSSGLDSGPILFHTRPDYTGQDPFVFTMEAVKVVQEAILKEIIQGTLLSGRPVQQETSLLIRYSKNSDFTEAVAESFLSWRSSHDSLSNLLTMKSSPEIRAQSAY